MSKSKNIFEIKPTLEIMRDGKEFERSDVTAMIK